MDVRDQCAREGIPNFFKQWGRIENNPNPQDPTAKQNGGTAKGGRLLDDRIWDAMPE
jgi:protein gp37